MRMRLPNILTLLRMVLIPVFILIYYLPFTWAPLATAIIFAVAAVTDWLDGFLARRWNQTSAFGAFLDPVADKLIVAVALVLLVSTFASAWFALPAAVIMCREILVSALREWMAELGKRAAVKVSHIGKVKTVAQMIALLVLLVQKAPAQGWQVWDWPIWFGVALMYVAAALTLYSMVIYIKSAWSDLTYSM
ncbi:CDP-diacylglycerol--glycerol-3-phosphate 3-phosphatidyltransferase [Piscirickettsia salmonis]|nr:CDP-diacylglycerol--glycerol-3-phosphate 3-phosphatidyltransferase [Piscirickettsia salmonis]AKP73282.1 CDP-diacylglycerol--glycerol-3-phosphate 3-phosphatidyltransferase [Piscirickettsia salmonis LF-89 = ATCC VR-1361]ALA24288.1 CDP-diacylglycerol--glycerol-3-phosphate 3-phosphatidyltransferase [Piscirickettsia salmonis]ALY02130.1 CDP-diacylglycerol--glycerol-3-phosphate 3-phosphatidyltransferase [Piscirickettsia salmonis]AMA43739.1 CDP-diacylglycerol--glycerol-3-phosphate 3-phosphatidyltran